MAPYRTVIFDFDGTIADSLQIAIEEMQSLSAWYRFRHFHAEEVSRLRGLGAREIVTDLGIRTWTIPLLIPHLRYRMKRRYGEIQCHQGIREALLAIGSNSRMVLLTSSAEKYVRLVLGTDVDRFESLVCGVPPFMKHKWLKNFDVENSIYVGDEVRDIRACHQVGMNILAVGWGYNDLDRLRAENPLWTASYPAEMTELLTTRRS